VGTDLPPHSWKKVILLPESCFLGIIFPSFWSIFKIFLVFFRILSIFPDFQSSFPDFEYFSGFCLKKAGILVVDCPAQQIPREI